MRGLRCFFIFANFANLLFAVGYDVKYFAKDKTSFEISWTLKNYEILSTNIQGQNYSYVDFSPSVRLQEKGFPEVPMISEALAINGVITTSQILEDDWFEVPLDYLYLPSRGVLYRNQNPQSIPYTFHPDFFSKNIYPEFSFTPDKPFQLQSEKGQLVRWFPFQYLPRSQKLRVHKTLKVLIKIKPAVANLRSSPPSLRPEFAQSFFLNANTSINSLKKIHEPAPGLLVIFTSRDRNIAKSYIQWKIGKGFDVLSFEMPRGSNVKNLIAEQAKRSKTFRYVQIFGDWEDLKSDLGPQNAPMDPYLGAVFGDDSFIDIYVGRFSGTTSREIEVQVQKSKDHELFNSLRSIGIASDEGQGMGDDNESDEDHMETIRRDKLIPFGFQSVYQAYQAQNATKEGLIKEIVSGVSLINYVGHGDERSWVTTDFSVDDIAKLKNQNQLPVVISVACLNGAFHSLKEAFAEKWLRQPHAGALATLMATINQPWTPPMRGQDYINDLWIGGYDYSQHPGQSGITTSHRPEYLGDLVYEGINLMYRESAQADDLETLKTWTLFGDVALKLW